MITGGLGGLGVRAAKLLSQAAATGVVLASRSGCIARDGQGLQGQLQDMGTFVSAIACDAAELRDWCGVLQTTVPIGVLHAAGTGDKGLLCLLYTSPSPRDS